MAVDSNVREASTFFNTSKCLFADKAPNSVDRQDGWSPRSEWKYIMAQEWMILIFVRSIRKRGMAVSSVTCTWHRRQWRKLVNSSNWVLGWKDSDGAGLAKSISRQSESTSNAKRCSTHSSTCGQHDHTKLTWRDLCWSVRFIYVFSVLTVGPRSNQRRGV